ELGAVAPVEIGPPAREVASERLGCPAAHGHDSLLAALADAADEALVEVDARAVEARGLADTQSGRVEELDERMIAEGPRCRPLSGFDQPFGLGRGERARQTANPAWRVERRRRIVHACADELLVAEEGPDGGEPRSE